MFRKIRIHAGVKVEYQQLIMGKMCMNFETGCV